MTSFFSAEILDTVCEVERSQIYYISKKEEKVWEEYIIMVTVKMQLRGPPPKSLIICLGQRA